jgi:hypothetical protein
MALKRSTWPRTHPGCPDKGERSTPLLSERVGAVVFVGVLGRWLPNTALTRAKGILWPDNPGG